MLKFPIFPTLTLLLLSLAVCSQDFPYDKYDPRTLDELVTQSSSGLGSIPGDTPQLMLDAKPFYSAIRVKYAGRSRPLSADKLNLYKMWQKSMGVDEKVLSLLQDEYLFKECDKEYWLAVQKPIAAYFSKELKPSDTITLYLMVIGGLKLKTTESFDPAFLVNEFRIY